MGILEFSEVLMYKFYYDYIKNKYSNSSNSDSLMYGLKTEDVYESSSHKEMLHFSNYSTKSKYFNDSNKLVIGKMKCWCRN